MKIFSLGARLIFCSQRSSVLHFTISFNGYGDQFIWMLVTTVHTSYWHQMLHCYRMAAHISY